MNYVAEACSLGQAYAATTKSNGRLSKSFPALTHRSEPPSILIDILIGGWVILLIWGNVTAESELYFLI